MYYNLTSLCGISVRQLCLSNKSPPDENIHDNTANENIIFLRKGEHHE